MKDNRRLPAGMTPRLLSRDEASLYCGLLPSTFDRTVAKSVQAIKLANRVVWDVRAIDRWLDQVSGLGTENDDLVSSMAGRFNGNAGTRR
jgi:hypothetical protein